MKEWSTSCVLLVVVAMIDLLPATGHRIQIDQQPDRAAKSVEITDTTAS